MGAVPPGYGAGPYLPLYHPASPHKVPSFWHVEIACHQRLPVAIQHGGVLPVHEQPCEKREPIMRGVTMTTRSSAAALKVVGQFCWVLAALFAIVAHSRHCYFAFINLKQKKVNCNRISM